MEPTLGEITMFCGNFAPRGWAFCNGQLLAIGQNQALFSILGTTYGGDGRTTFALPDLRGRTGIGAGQGPGLTDRRLGSKGGQETVTLTGAQMPSHTHHLTMSGSIKVTEEDGTTNEVAGNYLANSTNNSNAYTADAPNAQLHPDSLEASITVGNTGGNQGHQNMPPFQCLNYIIALQGLFPSRS